MSRILGLDPGFASVGWAVIDVDDTCTSLVALGVLRTRKANRKQATLASSDNFRRAREIGRALGKLALDHHVECVCAESMSFPRSSSVAAKMAMCWGVLAELCEVLSLPLVQASPQEIKLAVAGSRQASKDDVSTALSVRFPDALGLAGGLPAGLHEHAFDAAAAVVACIDSEVVRACVNGSRRTVATTHAALPQITER